MVITHVLLSPYIVSDGQVLSKRVIGIASRFSPFLRHVICLPLGFFYLLSVLLFVELCHCYQQIRFISYKTVSLYLRVYLVGLKLFYDLSSLPLSPEEINMVELGGAFDIVHPLEPCAAFEDIPDNLVIVACLVGVKLECLSTD